MKSLLSSAVHRRILLFRAAAGEMSGLGFFVQVIFHPTKALPELSDPEPWEPRDYGLHLSVHWIQICPGIVLYTLIGLLS